MDRNIKLTLEYDGTGLHGFQKQPGLATVQGELETALQVLLKEEVLTKGAGRTDAGVHATHQVVNFRTGPAISLDRFSQALNGIVDPRIRVKAAEDVAAEFHARRSAVSKRYCYYILNGSAASPFRMSFADWKPRQLDLGLMQDAADRFVGEHDFSAFCIHSPDKPDRVRTVRDVCVRQEESWAGSAVVIEIEANSFLHRMVRLVVGTLVRVGLGSITVEEAERVLLEKDKDRAGPSAPAKGLFLTGVSYVGGLAQE